MQPVFISGTWIFKYRLTKLDADMDCGSAFSTPSCLILANEDVVPALQHLQPPLHQTSLLPALQLLLHHPTPHLRGPNPLIKSQDLKKDSRRPQPLMKMFSVSFMFSIVTMS